MSVMDKNPLGEDERYQLFVQQFARHDPALRRFLRSLLPAWDDVDEVAQRTALVCWRKFDQYDAGTSFLKWACVIARFEALAYRRKLARDRLVFNEELLELMAEEGMQEVETREQELLAMESCLQELPEEHRKFLTLAYTPGVKVAELAGKAGSTAAAFYTRLNRLRHQLLKCIESKILALEGG